MANKDPFDEVPETPTRPMSDTEHIYCDKQKELIAKFAKANAEHQRLHELYRVTSRQLVEAEQSANEAWDELEDFMRSLVKAQMQPVNQSPTEQ